MNNHDANINSKDENGNTALHRAARHGNAENIRNLLKAGADIHATNDYNGTPLHLAAREGHTEAIIALLKAGANIDAMNSNNGDTPLHVAAQGGETEAVTTLLNAKANIHAKNKNGSSPLHFATLYGDPKIVIALLNTDADANLADNDADTPLHWAAEDGEIEIVTALLNRGANINATNKYGNTPLHWAADGKTEIVTALLNAGVNVDATNNEGETPIVVAFENGHHPIVRLLQAQGAVLPAHLAQPLPGMQVNPRQSTHTQSVHESLAKAASALYQKYMHFDFYLISDFNFNEAHAKKSRTKKLYLSEYGAYLLTDADGNVDRKGFIPENSGFNLNNLREVLNKPSFQQAILKATGILDNEAVLSEINRFADTLNDQDWVEGAAKRCLARLPSIDFKNSRSGVTLYQALICVWLGLHDTQAIQGQTLTPEDITARRKTFVQHLYQMQRGNNLNQQGIDDQRADKIICTPGHFNQLIDTLNGGHDLVNTLMVNAGTVSFKAAALANDVFLTLEQAIQTQYAPLWKKEEGVPKELLPHLQAAIAKPLRAEFEAFKDNQDFEIWITDALSDSVLGCAPPPKSVLALQEKILAEQKAVAESKALETQMAELEIEDTSPSTKRRFR